MLKKMMNPFVVSAIALLPMINGCSSDNKNKAQESAKAEKQTLKNELLRQISQAETTKNSCLNAIPGGCKQSLPALTMTAGQELANRSTNINESLTSLKDKLTQVKNSCVMIVFDKPEGSTHKLNEKDKLRIVPEGTWHIHSNPSDKLSITYWYFEGDIRYIVDDIRKNIK